MKLYVPDFLTRRSLHKRLREKEVKKTTRFIFNPIIHGLQARKTGEGKIPVQNIFSELIHLFIYAFTQDYFLPFKYP